MRKSNTKKDILISIAISLVLLCLLCVANWVPVQSYSGLSVCGTKERYSILNNGINDYSNRVRHFEDYDKKLDPEGAAPAIACPEGGKISLYLL